MASLAHCAYCFESLAASLEKRRALNLRQVEELWTKYDASSDDEGHGELIEDADMEDDEMDDAHPDPSPAPAYRPAAISRLLSPTNASASASSSSISSTPSSDLTDRSSSSKTSSSRSSIFSIPRRFRRQAKPTSPAGDHPLFVTWNTVGSHGGRSLRGCIGTFEPQELDDGLRSYALTSAFDDTRFRPVPHHELPSLECGVTLLTDFENAPDPMSWELGKHGLRISFTWHGRRYGATYLPDVPREQGWTKEETMISLMKKAGWNGKRTEWRSVGDLQVVRYQGSKCTMDYGMWREWRDWVDEMDGPDKMALN